MTVDYWFWWLPSSLSLIILYLCSFQLYCDDYLPICLSVGTFRLDSIMLNNFCELSPKTCSFVLYEFIRCIFGSSCFPISYPCNHLSTNGSTLSSTSSFFTLVYTPLYSTFFSSIYCKFFLVNHTYHVPCRRWIFLSTPALVVYLATVIISYSCVIIYSVFWSVTNIFEIRFLFLLC